MVGNTVPDPRLLKARRQVVVVSKRGLCRRAVTERVTYQARGAGVGTYSLGQYYSEIVTSHSAYTEIRLTQTTRIRMTQISVNTMTLIEAKSSIFTN